MRFLFLVGGFAGFILGGGVSLGAGHEPGRVFLDAALGCLGGAVLLRWFWNVLVRGLEETMKARHDAQAAGAGTADAGAAGIAENRK